jgi:hypothetical protein
MEDQVVYTKMKHSINNAVVRFWTNKQLAKTVREAKASKVFRIEKTNGFTRLYDPAFFPGEEEKLILSSLPGPNGMNMVRIDPSYFENESNNQ